MQTFERKRDPPFGSKYPTTRLPPEPYCSILAIIRLCLAADNGTVYLPIRPGTPKPSSASSKSACPILPPYIRQRPYPIVLPAHNNTTPCFSTKYNSLFFSSTPKRQPKATAGLWSTTKQSDPTRLCLFRSGSKPLKAPKEKPTKPNRAYSPSTKAHNKNPAKRSFGIPAAKRNDKTTKASGQSRTEVPDILAIPSPAPTSPGPRLRQRTRLPPALPIQTKQPSTANPPIPVSTVRQYAHRVQKPQACNNKQPSPATGNSHRHAKGAKPESGKEPVNNKRQAMSFAGRSVASAHRSPKTNRSKPTHHPKEDDRIAKGNHPTSKPTRQVVGMFPQNKPK